MKNLSADEVGELLPQLAGEIVIHFRWASVGGVNPRLCHPFPVDRGAETKLSGTTKTLLFHNGTWRSHASALEYLEREQERKIAGPISDSRVLALLLAHTARDSLALPRETMTHARSASTAKSKASVPRKPSSVTPMTGGSLSPFSKTRLAKLPQSSERSALPRARFR